MVFRFACLYLCRRSRCLSPRKRRLFLGISKYQWRLWNQIHAHQGKGPEAFHYQHDPWRLGLCLDACRSKCGSEQDPRVEQWAPHVRAAFALIGCDTSLLNNFAPGNALVVLGRKDYPGQGILLTNPNVFDEPTQTWQTDLRKAMQSNFATGAISSTTVGPAV